MKPANPPSPPLGVAHLPQALAIATLGTSTISALFFIIAVGSALGWPSSPSLKNYVLTGIYGAGVGIFGAVPLSLCVWLARDQHRIGIAIIGGLLWAFITSATYNFYVYAVANC